MTQYKNLLLPTGLHNNFAKIKQTPTVGKHIAEHLTLCFELTYSLVTFTMQWFLGPTTMAV